MTMLILDEPMTPKQMREYAQQIGQVDPALREFFQDKWNGDQTNDFYKGLLTGFAVILTLMKSGLAEYVPVATAFVADRLAEKEVV